MRTRVTIDIEVGDEPYADVITYHIYQYGIDSTHTIERPEAWQSAEAVEDVVLDILRSEFAENAATQHWIILDSQSLPNP